MIIKSGGEKMGKRMGEYRRRRTLQVGFRDKDGVLRTPNGHHGRSQKGCFGGVYQHKALLKK